MCLVTISDLWYNMGKEVCVQFDMRKCWTIQILMCWQEAVKEEETNMDKEYEEFMESLMSEIPSHARKDFSPTDIRFLRDGYTSDDPEEIANIRDTNLRYNHGLESDVLKGDFLFIVFPGEHEFTVRIHCGSLFDTYRNDGIDKVWHDLEESFEQVREQIDSPTIELLSTGKYEPVKNRLFIRPLNYNDNRNSLKGHVYKRFGDMVFVLYALIQNYVPGETNNLMSIKVPADIVNGWNVDLDEVWEEAMINTFVMSPPRVYFSPDEAENATYEKGVFMSPVASVAKFSPNQHPTVTTTTWLNGAIAMFYPGVAKRLYELFEDEYFIVFTSIHDATLHKVGTTRAIVLKRKIKDLNSHFAGDGEMLTTQVYKYNAETDRIEQCQV